MCGVAIFFCMLRVRLSLVRCNVSVSGVDGYLLDCFLTLLWLGDPFHDKESEQFVARYIERAPLSLEKLSIQDDIVTYTTKDGAAHEFDPLEFLAALSAHIPKTYESITRYYGRYSCRRRGERAKLSPPPTEEPESDYRREFRKSSWAACIKRIYEIDPLQVPQV